MIAFLRSLYCLVHGHTDELVLDRSRIYLRCLSCKNETPGWTVTRGSTWKVIRFKRRLAA